MGAVEPNRGEITTVACTTTASAEHFTLEIYHGWSPNGANRFVELVQDDYFTDVALFRCVKNFLVQFGIAPHASSPKKKYWREKGAIKDDPSLGIDFKRGMLSYAGSGPDSRGTQLFITFKDLPHLGKALWETPLGVVTQGMDSVVDKFYTGYGDQQPFNKDGINQGTLQQQGNEYLKENFPSVTYFRECHVVPNAGVRGDGDDNGLGGVEIHAALQKPDGGSSAVPDAIRGGVPQNPAELARQSGTTRDQDFFYFALVVLAVLSGAVFVVWKRNTKDRRREA